MPTRGQIDSLTDKLKLTPYQTYMIAKNGYKYDLKRLVKRGDVLYAPYKCRLSSGVRDWWSKLFLGPRADLIGADRLLVRGERGVKLYPTGFYKFGHLNSHMHYSDSNGNVLNRRVFKRIVRL